MSKIPRQAIVSIAAIAGAQLANLVLSPPQAGQSSSCLQWASESLDAARQNLEYAVSPPQPKLGYYDVRTHRDEPLYPVAQPSTPDVLSTLPDDTGTRTQAAALPSRTAAPPDVNSLTAASDREIDQQIAASRGQTLNQYYASIQNGGN